MENNIAIKNVLITGATGNVGIEVINALQKINHSLDIIAGVRNLYEESGRLHNYKLRIAKFDFTNATTYAPALQNCDILFLLRPPQISDTEKYFKPLIEVAKACKIKHIIFLSLQGVEKSSIIPHHKIEKMIVDSKIPFTFLRPAYFMQNFTTTLKNDLVQKKQIFLPAGNAKFTLVDVRDIGAVAARVIVNSSVHANKTYELTCNEALTFTEMAEKISNGIGEKITFVSPNLVTFFLQKRKEKVPAMFILVLIMQHYLPRFQKQPAITSCVKDVTGVEPILFNRFIQDNKEFLK
jgi:uncharacterized protein YbjT (DUF2867 family)